VDALRGASGGGRVIEVVLDERCTRCHICVLVCPTNVFDAVPDQPPAITRQEDCQTCFMCESIVQSMHST
jgi:Pyruvate/2-oxoacid:ferredoxin oxidoreductase delta subunit